MKKDRINKKKVGLFIFIAIFIVILTILLSRYCLLDSGYDKGIIGQWWSAPGPNGNVTFCCPLDSVCL